MSSWAAGAISGGLPSSRRPAIGTGWQAAAAQPHQRDDHAAAAAGAGPGGALREPHPAAVHAAHRGGGAAAAGAVPARAGRRRFRPGAAGAAGRRGAAVAPVHRPAEGDLAAGVRALEPRAAGGRWKWSTSGWTASTSRPVWRRRRRPCWWRSRRCADGRKVVLAVESGYRESTESWATVLRGLKERGLRPPRLVIGDGHLGIWGALSAVFPEAAEQRCWNHRIVNVLDKLPQEAAGRAKVWLKELMYAATREQADQQKGKFQTWCDAGGLPRRVSSWRRTGSGW